MKKKTRRRVMEKMVKIVDEKNLLYKLEMSKSWEKYKKAADKDVTSSIENESGAWMGMSLRTSLKPDSIRERRGSDDQWDGTMDR